MGLVAALHILHFSVASHQYGKGNYCLLNACTPVCPAACPAQAYLQQRLGQYLTIATLNANLLRNLMTAWLVYDEQRQRYVNFDEAADLVEACKQQQQQSVAAAAAAAPPVAAAAAAAEGQQQKAPVLTASIPLEKLLGVKVGANGSISGRRQQQQEQLAGSGSTSAGAAGV